MEYRVTKNFIDLHDGNRQYNIGDEYPRAGLNVRASRIEELLEKKVIKVVGGKND